ncbi:MAG: hypothetical protein ABI480_03245 [Chitinophagaceae bacterium]
MKKLYPFILSTFLIAGCSKDAFKSYDSRIEGTWLLTDVDRRGIGGSVSHLPFTEGKFIFASNGGLTYTNSSGALYNGTWDIKRSHVNETDSRTLLITAVDFTSQDVKSEFFNDMNFTGTNHFKAFIESDFHTYVYHFKRQ